MANIFKYIADSARRKIKAEEADIAYKEALTRAAVMQADELEKQKKRGEFLTVPEIKAMTRRLPYLGQFPEYDLGSVMKPLEAPPEGYGGRLPDLEPRMDVTPRRPRPRRDDAANILAIESTKMPFDVSIEQQAKIRKNAIMAQVLDNAASQNPTMHKLLQRFGGAAGLIEGGYEEVAESMVRGLLETGYSEAMLQGGTPQDEIDEALIAVGLKDAPKPSDYTIYEQVDEAGNVIDYKPVIHGTDELPDPRAGWRKAKTTTTDVTINMPGKEASKKIISDLQEDILAGETHLQALDLIDIATDPEYLTMYGRMAVGGRKALENMKLTSILPKLGAILPFGPLKHWNQDTGAAFAQKYSSWKLFVDKYMLEWRKFITGVAGGEKEMEFIQKTTINVNDDTWSTFQGKMKAIRIITKAMMEMSKKYLGEGFSLMEDPRSIKDPLKRKQFEQWRSQKISRDSFINYISPEDMAYLSGMKRVGPPDKVQKALDSFNLPEPK